MPMGEAHLLARALVTASFKYGQRLNQCNSLIDNPGRSTGGSKGSLDLNLSRAEVPSGVIITRDVTSAAWRWSNEAGESCAIYGNYLWVVGSKLNESVVG